MFGNAKTAAPKSRPTTSPTWWIVWFLLLTTVLVTGLLVLDQVRERQRIYNQILQLRVQQDKALSEFSRLQIERGSEISYERVVTIATSDMGMKFPDQIVTVEQQEEEH